MPQRANLAGQTFGRLTALEYVGPSRHGAVWRCRCECGGVKDVAARRLVEGDCRSCGCLYRESNARKWQNPATVAKVRESVRKLWEPGGAKRVAHEARFGSRPPRPRRPSEQPNEAANALAEAFGLMRRV